MTLTLDDAFGNINFNIASQINNQHLLGHIDVRNTWLEDFDYLGSKICQNKVKHQPENHVYTLEKYNGVLLH